MEGNVFSISQYFSESIAIMNSFEHTLDNSYDNFDDLDDLDDFEMNSAEYIDCAEARLTDIDHKWKVLFNQKTRAPIYNVDQYIETLKQYTDKDSRSVLTTTNGSNNVSDIHPVSYFLRKLKLDLKMSYRSFLDDFTQSPNNGLEKLVKLLKAIQKATKDISSATGRSKIQNTKRLLNDEHDCLLCIRFCLRIQRAVQNLLLESYGLESVASALMSSNTKSRVTAIEIMIMVLTEKDGFSRNLDCFTYFRLKNCEPIRFKFLIGMLMSNSVQNIKFQVCCMKYINSLLAAAPDSNTQIFLQNEIESAGLEIETLEDSLYEKNGPDIENLHREVSLYRKTRVDIDVILRSKAKLENQASNLQLKIFELQQEIKRLQARQKPQRRKLPDRHEETIITRLEQTEQLEDLPIPNQSSSESVLRNMPPPKSKTLPQKRLQHPRCKLQNLNWTPLSDVRDTIFESLDYNTVLEEIDLTLLEQNFCAKSSSSDNWTLFKTPRRNVIDDKVCFLDSSRAKSLLILQKRIGKSPPMIKQMIQTFEIDMLHTDDAELLLKFIPSEQEMKRLSSLTCTYEELGEAEQLLTQLMSIERIEEKLKLIIFMSQFAEDKVLGLKTQIKEINRMSSNLANNEKIRKILEIILAVGNFMNSDKHQPVQGFRVGFLSQLEDITSPDKSSSLIDCLVRVISVHYPIVHEWYKEHNVETPCKGSYQKIASELNDLEKGMQLLEEEITLCPCDQLNVFKRRFETDVVQLRTEFSEMESTYKNVCTQFGENYLKIEPQEFFGHFFKLADSYKRANAKLIDQKLANISNDFVSELKNQINLKMDSDSDFQDKGNSVYPDMYIESPRYGKDEPRGSCECCREDRKTCSYDPYGIMIDATKHVTQAQTDENWIISQTDTFSEKNKYKNHDRHNVRKRTIESGVFCGSDGDSESGSYDSAFVGSIGRPKSCKDQPEDKDYFVEHNNFQKSSTTQSAGKDVIPIEPEPDYPACSTPVGSVRSYSSEVSRILREFEGSLSGYDGEVEVIQNARKFYTIKSIIYL